VLEVFADALQTVFIYSFNHRENIASVQFKAKSKMSKIEHK